MPQPFDYAAHGLIAPERRPELPGGPQTIAEILDPQLAQDPDREALVGRFARLSYGKLDREANRAAHALAALGVRPGDRVAVTMSNQTELVVMFLASMRLGAIWVGINRQLAAPEKAYVLRDSGACVYLASDEVAAQIAPLRDEIAVLRELLSAEPGDPESEWARRLAETRETSRPRVEIDPFAPAAIAYTSGTTGVPKGAVHSQHNILLPGAVAREERTYAPEIRHGVVLPLTILNLIVLGPMVAFQLGSPCVAIDRIDPEGLAEWIRRERVGHFWGVPTIFHDLLNHPGVRAEDLATLERPGVGGAECPEEFRRQYKERFGAEVTIGYGMTEAPTAVSASDGKLSPLPGLCGKALPQCRILIRNEQGRELPAGEVGEICVGPASQGRWAGVYTPMLGYWKKPEETRRALRDGWLHTGDLGFLDPEGNLFIRGRRNELILRGGANVYPAEVERVLQEDERVVAAAVVGVPDERLGEDVIAFVELAPGQHAAPDELRERCAAQLARYKVPRTIHLVDRMPRNAMNKIVKKTLLERLEA
ncbi:MAG: class I adenylate-forming enzyme family protein [Myxococcota bacterium]